MAKDEILKNSKINNYFLHILYGLQFLIGIISMFLLRFDYVYIVSVCISVFLCIILLCLERSKKVDKKTSIIMVTNFVSIFTTIFCNIYFYAIINWFIGDKGHHNNFIPNGMIIL